MENEINFTKKIIEGQLCFFSDINNNLSPLTFIIVPGNPSIEEFYFTFAVKFIQKFNSPVIISSLASDTLKNYSLQNVIEKKKNFFEYLFNMNPNGKYIVIGHSIGNYILLKAIQSLNDSKQIIGIYNLFPAIQNLYNGFPLKFKILTNNIIIINICAIFSSLFQILPLCLIILFFKLISRMSRKTVECLARNINYSFTKQMLLLAKDEANYIKDYTDDFIKFLNEISHKIKMVYGKNDKYGNEEIARKFKELVPKVELKIVNIKHTFAPKYSQDIFYEIYDWIKNDIDINKLEMSKSQ